MKLKEIVLAAGLGASALTGCDRDPKAMLEPIAVGWSTGPLANYRKVEDAREAVYGWADTDEDGKVSYEEAKAMIQRCPESNEYNCD
ncbi:MAG: hypothetical protein AB1668_03075 [Nanoarchaeota archaeon]